MDKKSKEYREFKNLVKSVYKAVLKNMRDKARQQQSQDIVNDILDVNNKININQEDIPPTKDKVLYKKKKEKFTKKPKGLEKLKNFKNKVNKNK